MNQSITSVEFDQFTIRAFERIIRTLLDEIALGYVQGNSKFLRALGVTAQQAQIIENTERQNLARQLVSEWGGAIQLTLDHGALQKILTIIQEEDKKARQCRELINAGATNEMLNDLGFSLARPGVSSREGFTGMRATHPTNSRPSGRVQNLTLGQMQSLHRYWLGYRNTNEVDPIDHLIRSAEYLNVPVASIWKYIMEDPQDDNLPLTPEGVPRWVSVMFPNTGQLKPARRALNSCVS